MFCYYLMNSVKLMKRSQDWLNQANADLRAAKNALNSKDYAWSCFLAQQVAEKSFKAIGEEFDMALWGHDLVDLLKGIKQVLTIPVSIETNIRILNLYYTTTRYPDVFTTGFPAEKFSEVQARDAIKYTTEVLEFARDKIDENRKRIEKTSQS